ncbi:SHOCT domain-containing protein [Phenylobacterium sp.]|uniref:SHOCT domain-containing protein n=1 Tax=Phenylobacterium sp. TaxID=1871053 RepID=UPI0025DC4E75|nr:SHOCT domain-containing protein [Phenylobacterium sp.]
MKGVVSLAQAVGIWLLIVVLSFGVGLVPLAIWAAMVFLGAAERADKANAQLDKTLMSGETVVARAIQNRVFALFKRRAAIAITSSRILVIQRGLLGGFRMADMQWKDLKDARLEENIAPALCGSNLAFDTLAPGGAGIYVDGIASDAAAAMYAKAQYEEQAWEEKRRVRGLEETRAASGGVVIGAGEAAGSGAQGERMVDEIRKAKELLDAGAISDAEFQEMKAKILGRA